MSVLGTAWYREERTIEPNGKAGNASFMRFVHGRMGVVLYLFWNWKQGWYLELQGHGRKELVVLYGTNPDAPMPKIPKSFLVEAEHVARQWELAR